MVKLTNLRVLVVLVVLAAVAAASVVGVATAAPPDHAQSEHQRIVEFWTHARVAQAIPRDFVLDANGLVPRGKPGGTPGNGPGGGGGGGDGGDTTDPSVVTGASWTAGGDVAATTGKVLFALGSSYYVCSASVVVDSDAGTSLVLTAAHCAYDESNGSFAENWMFIPDYDSAPASLTKSGSFCVDTEYGCWTAQALTVHSQYAGAGGFNDQAVEYDFAFATMGNGGKTSALVEDVVGTQGIDFETTLAVGDGAHAFGYPAAKKYKGNDLVYCAGPTDTDPGTNNVTYSLVCDMTGGSSGGPWFASFDEVTGTGTLASVNSYGYRGSDSMHGPMLDADAAAVHAAATGASGLNDSVTTP